MLLSRGRRTATEHPRDATLKAPMQKTLALVDDPLFSEHVAPAGHPERPERLHAARAAIACAEVDLRRIDVAARGASDEELARVHTQAYLHRLNQAAGRSGYMDEDTFFSPHSVAAARVAAGAAVVVAETLLEGRADFGLALVRPPGHHARPGCAMGFCLLNNVAVAAAHARARGVARVAIVDFDVHHGNGTQEIFYADPSVLYLSLHQSPLYPGTGACAERGLGDGHGYNLNIPLSAGADDAVYSAAVERIVAPVLESFQPGLVLFSAGFDAHARDPLAQMQMTDAGFRALLRRALAALAPGVGVGLVLEGGYDLQALGQSLGASLEGLGEGPLRNLPATPLWATHEHDLSVASAAAAELWKLG